MFRQLSLAAALIVSLAGAAAATTPGDLNDWFLVEDPAHPNLSSVVSVDGVMATLSASGAVPDGTDIGYQSVDGPDVAGSFDGFAFSPFADFRIAIDFDLSFMDSVGDGGIGFGIGEDRDGTDSAGVALTFVDGITQGFAGASRVDDITQLPDPFGPIGGLAAGRLFVSYNSATGDITVGVSSMHSVNMAEFTTTLSALQNQWDNEDLLVSFFLRSEDIPNAVTTTPPLVSGDVDAVFSNFEVLDGTPILVPEPTGAFLALLASWRFPRRHPRRR